MATEMPTEPMKRTTRNALAALVILAVVGAVWVVGTSAADPNVAAVQAVAVDTMVIEHRVAVPDLAVDAVVSAADASRLSANADAAAKAHYAGPLLATRLEQFETAINDQVGGKPTALDGGVKDIVLGQTTISTDTATVHLRATTWAKVSQGGEIATPIATNNWIFELTKIDGQWFVTSEDNDFHG